MYQKFINLYNCITHFPPPKGKVTDKIMKPYFLTTHIQNILVMVIRPRSLT